MALLRHWLNGQGGHHLLMVVAACQFAKMKSHLMRLILMFVATAFAQGATVTYTSASEYQIHGGPAFFSQSFQVSGLTEPITEVQVTFTRLTHEVPGDIDALLVGPTGDNVMLMSDVTEDASSPQIIDVDLNFRDGALPLPTMQTLTTGTYAPTNYVGVEEIPEMDRTGPNPPPPGPYGATFAVFNNINPNGTWTLYIQDDRDDDSGVLSRWSLTVTTIPEPTSIGLLLFAILGVGSQARTRNWDSMKRY